MLAELLFVCIMFCMNMNCTVCFVIVAGISLNTLLLRRQAH